MTTPDCPECEKIHAVAPFSQKIGEFIEWMATEKGAVFSEYHEHSERCFDEEGYRNCGLRQHEMTRFYFDIGSTLAEFFGINLAVVETERRALLELLRGGQ